MNIKKRATLKIDTNFVHFAVAIASLQTKIKYFRHCFKFPKKTFMFYNGINLDYVYSVIELMKATN